MTEESGIATVRASYEAFAKGDLAAAFRLAVERPLTGCVVGHITPCSDS